jgi:type 1 fimbriae regulatory protein FimB
MIDNQKTRKFHTENEIERLLIATKNARHAVRDSCLIFWMYRRGWRVSEACNFKLENLDLDARMVYVNRSKNVVHTTHPIATEEYKALKAWLKVRDGYKGASSEYLFITERGGAMDRKQVFYLLKRYGEIAGLETGSHPHMLRHACGYALSNKGIDTRGIQTYLGHRNIQSTTIYTETNAERFKGFWD